MTGERRKFRREGEERRRDALISAALDLIAEGGPGAATVRAIADQVVVMQHGKVVEQGSAKKVLQSPDHPYTRRLIEAVPVPDPSYIRPPSPRLSGDVPSPVHAVGAGPARTARPRGARVAVRSRSGVGARGRRRLARPLAMKTSSPLMWVALPPNVH